MKTKLPNEMKLAKAVDGSVMEQPKRKPGVADFKLLDGRKAGSGKMFGVRMAALLKKTRSS